MELPTHELACAQRGKAVRAAAAVLTMLVVLGWAAAEWAAPAHAYVETPQWAKCFNAASVWAATLEVSISPSANTTVEMGAPLTFSGESTAALTFAVASSAV